MRTTLDIPEKYLIHDAPEEFAGRLKLNAALLMFQTEEISAGAVCELAGVDRFTFLAECRRRNIAVIDYAAQELRAERDFLNEPRP